MGKIEVKFEKSDWLPVNVIAVKSGFDFTITFFCLQCRKVIGRVDQLQLLSMDKGEGFKLEPHKCKEERDEGVEDTSREG